MTTNSAKKKIGHFVDNDDGTVTDTRTSLMWMRCALGQSWNGKICTGDADEYTWNEAMALHHGFSGYDDWRLPDIYELKRIVKQDARPSTIDTKAFPNTPSDRFWSSSLEPDPDYAKFINFGTGNAISRDKGFSSYVRLVRQCNQSLWVSQADTHALAQHVVRTAIDFIRKQPEFFTAEIAELRGFLAVVAATPTSATSTTALSVLADPGTLEQVIAWLTTQESVPLSDLRARLLPLDLLPGAVINEINERALDHIGDPALEEDGDNVIVQREVLLQIITG